MDPVLRGRGIKPCSTALLKRSTMDGARLADAWTAFFAELETTYVALITISALFASRDCEATIKNLRSGVERFTQKPLNKTAPRCCAMSTPTLFFSKATATRAW